MVHAAVRPVTGPGKARVKAYDALADRNEVGRQTDDIEVALFHYALKSLEVGCAAGLSIGRFCGLGNELIERRILRLGWDLRSSGERSADKYPSAGRSS